MSLLLHPSAFVSSRMVLPARFIQFSNFFQSHQIDSDTKGVILQCFLLLCRMSISGSIHDKSTFACGPFRHLQNTLSKQNSSSKIEYNISAFWEIIKMGISEGRSSFKKKIENGIEPVPSFHCYSSSILEWSHSLSDLFENRRGEDQKRRRDATETETFGAVRGWGLTCSAYSVIFSPCSHSSMCSSQDGSPWTPYDKLGMVLPDNLLILTDSFHSLDNHSDDIP